MRWGPYGHPASIFAPLALSNSHSLQHDKRCGRGQPEPSEGQRTARRTPPGDASSAFRAKRFGSDSGPPRPWHSVLGPLSARPRRRRELKLVVTACWPALSSAPSSGAIPLACAFKQGLCEYLFKSAFSAPRARQSPRPARQTLRPASRYTDGRYRRPPPSCNCVSGSREPNRALREQQAPTARHTTQRKLKRRSHGLGRALAHGGLRAHRPRPS